VVKGDSLDLGSVGIVRGEDAAMAKASSVRLGKFSLTGQRIVLDRATILSCLASIGIKGDDVVISGASVVTVRREEESVGGARIIGAATEFLQKRLNGSVSSVVVITRPKNCVLKDRGGKIELVPRMSKYSSNVRPKVWVSVLQDGVEKEGFEISFSLKYKCRRAVTTADISSGERISKENVKIETIEASSPESSGWSSPYGMVAKRLIRKGTTLKGDIVGPVEPPVLIKRRQTVMVKVETKVLFITSFGEAMEEGTVGQFIRVKMGADRGARTIVGKVGSDGSVSPIF
jgi:flagella basal body P-ring formation protein FlgA